MQMALLIALLANPAPVEAPLPAPVVNLGGVLTFLGEYYPDDAGGTTGFLISQARLNLKARLMEDTEFFVQANLINAPPLLDLRLSWLAHDLATIDVGYLKVPVSAEFLLPIQAIDFTRRSQVVLKLGFGRQAGVQLRGATDTGVFGYKIGAFNGSGPKNEDGRFALAGRIDSKLKVGDGTLQLGVNGAYSEDDAGTFGLIPGFAGKRLVAGGDLRLEIDRFFLSAEALFANIEPVGADSGTAWGYHASAGYWLLVERLQAHARWDSFKGGDFSPDSDFVVVGFLGFINSALAFYLDAYIPPDDAGSTGVFFSAMAFW